MKLIIALLILFPFSIKSQDETSSTPSQEIVNLEEVTATSNQVKEVPKEEPLQKSNSGATDSYQFFKGQTTSIRNPFELRDPFRKENQRNKSGKKIRFGGVVEGTSFTNLPSIANVPIDKIKITGVLIGKERRAMAKIDGDNNMYVLKEGMVLGVDGAEIKAILPGGVVLVEKIRNIYDQDEYLETILTIAQE